MKHFHSACLALFALSLVPVRAVVPPPEQLLPGDTLVVITLPDTDKARAAMNATPGVQFWNSAGMQPFRDKFMGKVASDVIGPIEKELSVSLADYMALARGQITLAFVANAEQGKDPEGVILIDTKDKASDATRLLTDLKKRWTDAGKTLKKQTVRDVEFTTVTIDGKAIGKALEKTFPKPPGSATPGGDSPDKKSEICIGQSGSLLMIGEKPSAFEKILVRLSGGSLPPLADQPHFSSVHSANLRDSFGYVWINTKVAFDLLIKSMEKDRAAQPQDNPMAPPAPAKILNALGLGGIESMSVYVKQEPAGMLVGMFAGVPEANRKGLLKLFAPEAKDASPPAAVPADATKYFRWRLDGQKTWAGIEKMVVDLFPPAQGVLGMVLDNAGKDQDPNFDLRKMLIGNVGDDVISYARPPRTASLADVSSPPSLVLVGSPHAELLVSAFRTGLGSFLAPAGDGSAKDREFLGRKIYSIPMPAIPGTISTESKAVSYAASGSYVAISTDAPILEEYLRGPDAQGRPLRETPGLNEAAQKVGGMNTGMFGYENQIEVTRIIYEAVRKDPAAFEKMFEGPLGMSAISSEMRQNRAAWLDFSLLPPWASVAKYFSYSVYAGSSAAEGLHLKAYSPNPPGLKP